MIISKKPLSQEQFNIAHNLSQRLNLGIRLCKILVNRGIDSLEKAKQFLSPGKANFLSPYLLSGIQEAKQKILNAISQNKNILIFGDYDADGICATSVMYYTFKELGVEVQTYIPERDCGYGITQTSIAEIKDKNIDLIITVDCGISCKQEIKILNQMGIDVIVTDHHELPEELPEAILVNCKIKSDYPYNNLCGAGVAYKLSKALIGDNADKLLDFVALATVADSMDLTGENRDIVAEGLKLFANPRPQISALMELGKTKEISSGMLAFNLAPKINACGRMGNARLGLSLMLEQNLDRIKEIAFELNNYNINRQKECELLYAMAKSKITSPDLNSSVIVLYDDNWNGGLAGIVAAKISEEYNRPTIIFASNEDTLKGSARSIEGVNLYQSIEACKSLLEGFGGHSQAAGVSIKKENLTAFKKELNDYINKHFADKFVNYMVVEEFLDSPITIQEAKELNLLEPCGLGNKKPLFAIKGSSFMVNRLSGEHIAFKTDYLDMLYFNALSKAEEIASNHTKNVYFEPNYSVFNKKESVKGFVKGYEICLENTLKDKLILFENYLDLLSLQKQDKNDKILNKEDIDLLINKSLQLPYGTLFVITDLDNLSLYPNLQHLPVQYDLKDTDNLLNKVVVNYRGENLFSNVIYLDKGVSFNNGVMANVKPFNDFNFDRSTVVKVFGAFNNVYKSVQDMLQKNTHLNPFELIFAYKVLLELKIIKHKDYIQKDNSVKNEIINSTIYKNFLNR